MSVPCERCVLSGRRSLKKKADHSSGEVLRIVVYLSVIETSTKRKPRPNSAFEI